MMGGLHDNQWQTIVLLGHVLMHLDRDLYECAIEIFNFGGGGARDGEIRLCRQTLFGFEFNYFAGIE